MAPSDRHAEITGQPQNGDQVRYTYDAAGIKLRKEFDPAVGSTITYDYVAGFHYKNTILEFVTTTEGRYVFDDSPPTAVITWDFNSSTEGFVANNDISNFQQTGSGYIEGTIISDDPYIKGPSNINVSASQYSIVHIRLENNSSSTEAQLFFQTEADPVFTESKKMNFDIIPNSGFQDYYLDMSTVANWQGTIHKIRVDPSRQVTSGTFKIDEISILSKGGQFEYHIKDHLGNVRATVKGGGDTSVPVSFTDTTTYTLKDDSRSIELFADATAGQELAFSIEAKTGNSRGGSVRLYQEGVQLEYFSVVNLNYQTFTYTGTLPSDGRIYIRMSAHSEIAATSFRNINATTIVNTTVGVVSADDYYPFGLTFNGHVEDDDPNQDYKFQGQEYQQETGWNQFKWRNADPATGRFFNVDPLAEDYVYNSPYAFAENRVIDGRELEGLEWSKSTNGNEIHYEVTVKIKNSAGVPESSAVTVTGLIADQVEESFQGTDENGVSYTTTVDVDFSSEGKDGDFYIDLVDVVTDDEGKPTGYDGKVDEIGNTKTNRIQVDVTGKESLDDIIRTGAHEIGHTGGLEHAESNANPELTNDGLPIGKDNIMIQSGYGDGTEVNGAQLNDINETIDRNETKKNN